MRNRSFWRTVLVLCAVLAFAGLQITSATHLHQDAGNHFCAVCHASHIPAVRTVSEVRVQPQVLIAWLLHGEEIANVPRVRGAAQLSRGPPA